MASKKGGKKEKDIDVDVYVPVSGVREYCVGKPVCLMYPEMYRTPLEACRVVKRFIDCRQGPVRIFTVSSEVVMFIAEYSGKGGYRARYRYGNAYMGAERVVGKFNKVFRYMDRCSGAE